MLLSRVRVVGYSMEPALKHNRTVIVSSIPYFFKKPKLEDIVILSHQKCIIKRIVGIKKDKIFVVGDNKKQSTDSRNFGWINKKEIVGKVILKI